MVGEPVRWDFSPSAWDPWRPDEVARRLDGSGARWAVVGGAAVDLHLGAQTREHGDLEIIVPMWDFDLVRARFPEYGFHVAGREGFWPVDRAGEAYFEYQQTMVRDPESRMWKLDVMRVPDDGVHWHFTLDRSLRLPWAEAVHRDPDGVPYLAPELVLLYKAATRREKDERDFDALLGRLPAAHRAWLGAEVARLLGDGHPWVGRLAEVAGVFGTTEGAGARDGDA